MKKLFFVMAAGMAIVTGCKKNGTDGENRGFSIDSSAHSITFTIDTPVETFWITDALTSTTIEGTLNEEAQTISCKGDWFSAEVKIASSKEIILSVDENTSQQDRKLIISAYYMGQSGSMLITQEAL